ncbi:hypothetical protein jhhlp_004811 [Lomentospora prolificans]|uniref:Enoyl reductase (ER) domain-containing protein n=1 Tax=Lomentospora prolificans TaxID=41688 RepID=A0A2N3N8J4_9PEZI|nr:hypothetical protein jhhlp_004811 [Lomentospora prolificans]
MKAIQVLGEKAAPQIVLTSDLPKPVPKGNDILIKVYAAGITADEVTWVELYDSANRVPGHDISGVVEAVGPEYDGALSPGDEVYAMLRASASQGGQAEYVIASSDEVSPKPKSLSHAEAAALPIPILTAWEAISDHAKLEPHSKVLITGASGAVGLMLVQLAQKLADAKVIGLASPSNHDRLKKLGVSQVIDYNEEDWEQAAGQVDVVFDTAGSSTLSKSWQIVKGNGAIITVADPPPPWAFGRGKPEELREHPNVKWVYFVVTARAEPLARAAAFLDEGSMKPIPVKTFTIDQGLEAWAYAARRGREGKAVIQFDRSH